MAIELLTGKTVHNEIGILTGTQRQLSPIPVPADNVITLGAAVTTGATTLTVTGIGTDPDDGSGKGTALVFRTASAAAIYVLAADAAPGATSLTILPATRAIANAATCNHNGLECIPGTSSNLNVTSQDQTLQLFDCGASVDEGSLSGFGDGVVASQAWTVPYSGVVAPTDPGYLRIVYMAFNAVTGVQGMFRMTSPAPSGYTTGLIVQGRVSAGNYNQTNPADNIITYTVDLTGRGSPKLTYPV